MTGGAGYVGCVLVPRLLSEGHEVVVYDLMLFGKQGLASHDRLEVIEADIRDTDVFEASAERVDTVIHLACISNDPSFELNPDLSKSINYDCFEPMVLAAKNAGVRRFIYASTSSVYGVSEAPEVTEDHPLVPLTDYNKYKGLCEPQLLAHQSDDFTTVVIRPSTVCGYSPRMRLDLTVNILTNHAVNNGVITVFGGNQKRPNIHIEDMVDLYIDLIGRPSEEIGGQVFNAGYENFRVREIAGMVRTTVEQEMPNRTPIKIVTTPSDDKRSYHVCSRRIRESLGWVPRRTIENAVHDLCSAFREGKIPNSFDNDLYFNVRAVKGLGLE